MRRDAGQWYPVLKAAITPPCHYFWRFELTGREHLPKRGPAIVTPNHLSFFDSVVVPLVVGRRITFVGKAEYMDDWKTRYLFPAAGMIPIDRTGGESSAKALDAAADVLHRGELFGIYPEGTRSRSGSLHKGRTGVARLALRTGAPIVPLGLIGTLNIQPPDSVAPRPFMTVLANFGEPIDPADYRHRDGDPLLYREMTDEVMFELAQLSGQEYVHEYAGAAVESGPEERTEIGPLVTPVSSSDLLQSKRPEAVE